MKLIRPHRQPSMLLVMLALCLFTAKLNAQAGFRPTPCPETVTQRTLGIFEFWHDGYAWPGEWKLRIEYADGEGYYQPKSGQTNLVSLNGQGIWEGAAIIVNCQAETWWDGFGFKVKIHYHVHRYLGVVKKRCSGGSGLTQPTDHEYSDYDPYSSRQDDSTSYGSGSCSSASPDDTWNGGDGAEYTCYTAHIVIEVSDDGGKTWQVVWEGDVTECY